MPPVRKKITQTAQSLGVAIAILAVLWGAGCQRSFYRQRADQDVVHLVREKSHDPRWPLEDFSVYADPRSRMFDPTDPDAPPMPPDDPAAHRLMHCVDCKRGYCRWHRDGDIPFVENPNWTAYLPRDAEGRVRIDGREAVALARLHSPAYRARLESLYLSALDVSFERFQFDTQFFAGYQVQYTADGPDRVSPPNARSELMIADSSTTGSPGFRLERAFAGGGELVVGLANQIMWQFAGPNTQDSTTILDFALVQPLLRGAGRDRVLENLTFSERALLSNVRQMERYNRGFYLEVYTGRNAGPGPSRGGLGIGSLEGGRGGGASVGGLMGLLQQQQFILNQEANIRGLRSNLNRLQVFAQENQQLIQPDESPTQRKQRILQEGLQVAQAQQALNRSESSLLGARASYEESLDNFKRTLGLPPDLCLAVVDPLFERLQLIGTEIQRRQIEVNRRADEIGLMGSRLFARVEDLQDAEGQPAGRGLRWSEELEETLIEMRNAIAPVAELLEAAARDDLPRVIADLQSLRPAIDPRRRRMDRLRERLLAQRECPCPLLPAPDLDPALFDTERLLRLPAQLEHDLDSLREGLQESREGLKRLEEAFARVLTVTKQREIAAGRPASARLYAELRDDVVIAFQTLLSDLGDDVLALQLLQARARLETVELEKVELDPAEALEIARVNRRDWMNARTALVDAWRLIQISANDLESSLDVVFSGDMRNKTDNPLSLRGTTGRLRVGLRFDSPLTRLAERNDYRTTQLIYQQARREYYSYEDAVSQSLRATLRRMLQNEIDFEFQRIAVGVAAEQILINEAILEERQGQASGATAARDAVSALADLLNAQNGFLSVYAEYEVLRRSLDYDLGTMQLDRDGFWVDPGPVEGSMPLGCKPGSLPPIEELVPPEAELPPPEGILLEPPTAGALPPPAPLPEEDDFPPAPLPLP